MPKYKDNAAAAKLRHAKQRWRLCAAAEVVFAKLGARATVADILKEASMSRRSYYEHFDKLFHQVVWMMNASEASGIGPRVGWMLLAFDPTNISMRGSAQAEFDDARDALDRGSHLTMPEPAELIAWYQCQAAFADTAESAVAE